jgi:hypothetical protein
VAFNIKGDTMFCSELYWDKVTGRFYTDKKVILSLGFRSSVITALDGMNCNQELTDRHLFKIQNGSYTTITDSATADKPVAAPPATKPPK